ncbi:MAG TPA: hypothetical protein P5306_10515 [Kiritimatiellia bacterium]|nr:hypothetical protein [Kiritimatiellia bacterium]
MTHDALVDEVRKAREEILASYGGDVHKLLQDVMKRQWESGHKVVTLSGKKVVVAAKPRVAEAGAGYGAKEQTK